MIEDKERRNWGGIRNLKHRFEADSGLKSLASVAYFKPNLRKLCKDPD